MKKIPIIHQHYVVTSTYIIRDRGIHFLKLDFIGKYEKQFKKIFVELHDRYKKWWKHPLSQQMEIKIRVHFGYSPNTYSYDIMNGFYYKYFEYLQYKKEKK